MTLNDNSLYVSEAAKMLNITEYTVKRWLREGKLKGEIQGKKWIINKGYLLENFKIVQPPHTELEKLEDKLNKVINVLKFVKENADENDKEVFNKYISRYTKFMNLDI